MNGVGVDVDLVDAWAKTGDELRRVDPARFLAVLEVAQRIVAIHKDPLATAADRSFFVPSFCDDTQ